MMNYLGRHPCAHFLPLGNANWKRRGICGFAGKCANFEEKGTDIDTDQFLTQRAQSPQRNFSR
jgi:hypothetical protein